MLNTLQGCANRFQRCQTATPRKNPAELWFANSKARENEAKAKENEAKAKENAAKAKENEVKANENAAIASIQEQKAIKYSIEVDRYAEEQNFGVKQV